jgi:hypothetical protein
LIDLRLTVGLGGRRRGGGFRWGTDWIRGVPR